MLPGGVRGENNEKLEFDDPLYDNVMLLRPKRLQHEVEMVPKRPERTKKSRELTEKREKYADERPGGARGRSCARRRLPGGGGRRPIALIRRHRADLLFPRFRLDFRARWLRNLGFGRNSRNQRFVVR